MFQVSVSLSIDVPGFGVSVNRGVNLSVRPPQVRLTLIHFLPAVFMEAMRDNAEAAVQIFEGTHENPELIWNDSSRETVSTAAHQMMLEYEGIQYSSILIFHLICVSFICCDSFALCHITSRH